MDAFERYTPGLDAPATGAAAVTPSDSADLAARPRAIYVGTGGDLAVTMLDATGAAANVVLPDVPDGALLPIRPTRVLAAGTTASGLVALW